MCTLFSLLLFSTFIHTCTQWKTQLYKVLNTSATCFSKEQPCNLCTAVINSRRVTHALRLTLVWPWGQDQVRCLLWQSQCRVMTLGCPWHNPGVLSLHAVPKCCEMTFTTTEWPPVTNTLSLPVPLNTEVPSLSGSPESNSQSSKKWWETNRRGVHTRLWTHEHWGLEMDGW